MSEAIKHRLREGAAGPAGRFALLDPIRGIAALWVFVFHMPLAVGWVTALGPLYPLLRLGHMGVPMFFVVSGFCITAAGRAAAKSGTVGAFVQRRLRRIYPPYWFSIAVVCGLPFLMELISAAKTGRYTAPDANQINYAFLNYGLRDWISVLTLLRVFVPDPQAGSLQYKFTGINAVYWTLAIEVQFYLVVALAVIARSRFYTVLGLVTLVSLPFVMIPGSYVWGAFFPYWPMFAVGALVFWLFDHGLTPNALLGARAERICALAALATIGGFMAYVAAGGNVAPLPFAAVCGFVLFVGRAMDGRFQRVLSTNPGVTAYVLRATALVGAMSYTVYLLHGRVQFLSLQFARQLMPDASMARDAAVFLLKLLLCYPFFRWCELPFARPPRSGGQRRPEHSAGLSSGPGPEPMVERQPTEEHA